MCVCVCVCVGTGPGKGPPNCLFWALQTCPGQVGLVLTHSPWEAMRNGRGWGLSDLRPRVVCSQALPPVKRVKLLDAPPGLEYHKGPRALGMQGRPRTAAQLMREIHGEAPAGAGATWRGPGGGGGGEDATESSGVNTSQEIVGSSVLGDATAATLNDSQESSEQDSTSMEMSFANDKNSQKMDLAVVGGNVGKQAAVSKGLSGKRGAGSRTKNLSPGRIIYQAPPDNSQGPPVPVAIEMKLSAAEAAGLQLLSSLSEQSGTTQAVTGPTTVATQQDTVSKALTTTEQAAKAAGVFKLTTTYSVAPDLDGAPGSQGIRSVLFPNLVSGQTAVTSLATTTNQIATPQIQLLQQPIQQVQQHPVATSNNLFKLTLSPPRPMTSSGTFPASIVTFQQPQVSAQQQQPTTTTTMQQQQQQPTTSFSLIDGLYTVSPDYTAQDLFSGADTVSNVAQMRELIHGSLQSGQDSNNQ